MIETVRALQEVALHRAARNCAQAIVEMQSGETIGYELGRFDGVVAATCDPKFTDALDCPALLRACKLSREVAVEQAWNHFGDVLMFVSASLREASTSDLIDSLDRLKQRPSGEARLVVQMPYEMLSDTPRFRDLRDQLREIGVAVAIDRFAGPPSSLEALRGDPPDYLKLAASVFQAPEQSRQLQTLVKAAASMEVALIGCGLGVEAEWNACKSAGIRLAQGDFASSAMPLDACSGPKQ
jgi:EAL domain-containing protein (putative c-di-GMP-specific phosphodiesterase class I)